MFFLFFFLHIETQFFRVLWENLGVKLSDEEQGRIIQKYDIKKDGRLNYKEFCDVILTPFNSNDMKHDPASQQTRPLEL